MTAAMLSTAEAADLAGASPRQVDYWARSEWIIPEMRTHGPGTTRYGWARLWPPSELRVIACLTDFRGTRGGAKGTLPRIARAVRRAPKARYLIVEQEDGEVYTVDTDQALIGAVLEAVGWITVTRIRSIAELTGGTPT